jgi:hypothetical protein
MQAIFSLAKSFIAPPPQPLHIKIQNVLYKAVDRCDYNLAKKLFEEHGTSIDVRHQGDRCIRLLIAKHIKDQKSGHTLSDTDKFCMLLLKYGARPDLYELDFCELLAGIQMNYHHALFFDYACFGNFRMIKWLVENTPFDYTKVIPESIAASFLSDDFAIAVYLANMNHEWNDRQSRNFAGCIFKKAGLEGNSWFVYKLVQRGMVVHFDFDKADMKVINKYVDAVKDKKRRRQLEEAVYAGKSNSRDHPEILAFLIGHNKGL